MDHHRENRPPVAKMSYVRAITGVLVLAIGMAAAISVFQLAYSIISGGDSYGLLEKILSAGASKGTVTTPNGDVELPSSLFMVVGYLLIIFLLSICARISTSIIKSGAGIIRPDYDEIIQKIRKELKGRVRDVEHDSTDQLQ